MALQFAPQPLADAATLKTRENVSQLSDEALERLRSALTEMLGREDNRGYHFFAGWHGVPLDLCAHHDALFLPWHRGYLYHIELALQDIDPDVTMPWWDWVDEDGIPAAYEGGEENVLAGVPIAPLGVPRRPDWPERTFRQLGGDPSLPAPIPPPLRRAVIGGEEVDLYRWMMDSPSYTQFMQRCWRLHDNVHVWIGGTMSDQNWAAWDPIFWAHHSMVDRLWRIWQHNHPGGNPPQQLLDLPMSFGRAPALTVRDVLDVKALGYEYAGQADTVEGPT